MVHTPGIPLNVPLLFVKMVKRTKKAEHLVMTTEIFTADKSLSSQHEGCRLLYRSESGSMFQSMEISLRFVSCCLLESTHFFYSLGAFPDYRLLASYHSFCLFLCLYFGLALHFFPLF